MDGWAQRKIIDAASANFISKEAEECLIGCFIRDFKYCRSAYDELSADDFGLETYRSIYKAIKQCLVDQRAVDLITLSEELPKVEKEEGARNVILSAMIDAGTNTPTVAHVRSYLQIVKELSARRKAIQKVAEITEKLKDPTQDIASTVDTMRVLSSELISGKHEWVSMSSVMMNTYNYIDKRSKGEIPSITTGIPNIDRIVGGFFGGELTVIGARPAVGKSAFGMNIAMKASKQGYKIGVVSREMMDVQYGQRVLAYTSGVDGGKIRRAELEPEDWEKMASALGDAATMNIEFLFTVRSVEDLRAEVHRKAVRNELDMLIVDYLQLMTTSQKFEADRLRVGYVSRALKDIALDFDIPVIALAQVKRFAGGARAKMPSLEDLKDSGNIEQDADGVIFLHNPPDSEDECVDPRDKDYFDAFKENGYTYLVIGVAKQRQGPTGMACVLFDKRTMQYSSIARE